MATAKKTTAKKTGPAKKAPTKKTPAKKAAPAKKTSVKAKATPKVRSFHVSPNTPSFGTFKITRQTVYWVIIVSVIIFMQLWILSLQIETSNYIEAQLAALEANI